MNVASDIVRRPKRVSPSPLAVPGACPLVVREADVDTRAYCAYGPVEGTISQPIFLFALTSAPRDAGWSRPRVAMQLEILFALTLALSRGRGDTVSSSWLFRRGKTAGSSWRCPPFSGCSGWLDRRFPLLGGRARVRANAATNSNATARPTRHVCCFRAIAIQDAKEFAPLFITPDSFVRWPISRLGKKAEEF